ncbi:MAG: D-alanyl-D-alanine carboxypeptidase, partial [Gemmatimonadota bacterium]|nr:D-alanyl-D-alanine carboxypeptidase [Gemmatimonadota bacterium]
VLEMMAEGPYRELWYASLPVAGVDGTLARRLRNTPLQGRLRAKTGTLSGVRSLSGYLSNAAGEPILFSIMVNHHLRSAAGADRVIDAAVQRISESR